MKVTGKHHPHYQGAPPGLQEFVEIPCQGAWIPSAPSAPSFSPSSPFVLLSSPPSAMPSVPKHVSYSNIGSETTVVSQEISPQSTPRSILRSTPRASSSQLILSLDQIKASAKCVANADLDQAIRRVSCRRASLCGSAVSSLRTQACPQ